MERFKEYLINKIFTVPYIDKLIDQSKAPESFVDCITRYVENEDMTYGEAISEIYNLMNESYRNEYYYKNTIFNKLLLQKHNVYETAALTELPIGDSIADFIMINGKGVVYEIKTDLDNFTRLENQINDYYKVFSYVNVVVGKKQLNKVKSLLENTNVGIYVLYESNNLLCRKKARYDSSKLSYKELFEVLRKKEFEYILLKHYGKLPNVNSFYYYRECFKWISKINIKTLQREVMHNLKKRTLLEVTTKLEEEIPYELRFYAYFSKKNKEKYAKINQFYNKKMEV